MVITTWKIPHNFNRTIRSILDKFLSQSIQQQECTVVTRLPVIAGVDVTDKVCMHHLVLFTFFQTCPVNENMTVLLTEYMLLKWGA
jgi:hypothetical protein